MAADVTNEDAVQNLVGYTFLHLGRVNITVNNAGIGENAVPIDEKPSTARSTGLATGEIGRDQFIDDFDDAVSVR